MTNLSLNMTTNIIWKTYLDTGNNAYKSGDYQTAGKMYYAAVRESRKWRQDDPRLVTVLSSMAFFY